MPAGERERATQGPGVFPRWVTGGESAPPSRQGPESSAWDGAVARPRGEGAAERWTRTRGQNPGVGNLVELARAGSGNFCLGIWHPGKEGASRFAICCGAPSSLSCPPLPPARREAAERGAALPGRRGVGGERSGGGGGPTRAAPGASGRRGAGYGARPAPAAWRAVRPLARRRPRGERRSAMELLP